MINNFDKRLFVVDNFYTDPDAIRELALNMKYEENNNFYKGMRSITPYRVPETKEAFECIMGEKIIDFEGANNGCFQITSAENPQVYHCDNQKWAGMVYLTPNAPIQSGTRTHVSKRTGMRHSDVPDMKNTFENGFLDSTQFDIADSIGNVYNRLVIFYGHMIHSAGPYFGTNMYNGRLIHLFFFD